MALVEVSDGRDESGGARGDGDELAGADGGEDGEERVGVVPDSVNLPFVSILMMKCWTETTTSLARYAILATVEQWAVNAIVIARSSHNGRQRREGKGGG
ncbi:hypothetical protein HYQ46_006632 [Verticillium longisporum]|nr:hypothetical protein HYQ46_006632 [Verticillium longisporum]